MKTWGTLKGEIQAEYNITDEQFVTEAELLVWANDAKDEAEKEIVSLYDKYLETDANISLVDGTSLYGLPSDIYASKITALLYDDGSEKYEVKKLKRKRDILRVESNDDYKYRITNSTASGVQLKLYPASRVTSNTAMTMHYIRKSADLTGDDSYIDIPLADAFIKQYVKDKIKQKEMGPISMSGESQDMVRERKLLIEALNQMIPSDDADSIDLPEETDDFYINDLGEYSG